MDIMESISNQELDAMRSYIVNYGDAQGTALNAYRHDLNMNHILRFWAQEKQNLFRIFGEKLILTKRVSIKKTPIDMRNEIQENLLCKETDGWDFYYSYKNLISKYCTNDKTYYGLKNLISVDALAHNLYVGETFTISVSDDKPIIINHGCKVSKMLGKIAKVFNLEGYEKFRIAHSICLNQKNIEGDVCLSIHPLDYMTMSDNDNDWDTCLSWRGGGDCRQGTIEMMNSPFVVVAYVKSKTDMRLDNNFKWNNKKWRQLYIITPEIIMSIKQYPYENDDLDTFCLRWLLDLTNSSGLFGLFHSQMCKICNRHDNVLAFMDKTVHCIFESNYMYNDIYSAHNAFVNIDIPEAVQIIYSGTSECIQCGAEIEVNPDIVPANSLLCECCGSFMKCDECGKSISEDSYYYVDDACLCECCYENYTGYCEWCEESHFTENLVRVYLKVNNAALHPNYSVFLCDNCINSAHFKQKIGENPKFDEHLYHYCLDIEDLTEIGLDFFQINKEELDFEML